MKTSLPILGSAFVGLALAVVAFCLPPPWGLPVASLAGSIVTLAGTWEPLSKAGAEAAETRALLHAFMAGRAQGLAAQAREIAKECQEEAIRSAVSAVAESPDPR